MNKPPGYDDWDAWEKQQAEEAGQAYESGQQSGKRRKKKGSQPQAKLSIPPAPKGRKRRI